MKCEFSPEELELVTEIMQVHQETLIRDISRSDHRDYKQMLRGRLKILEGVLEKLKLKQAA
jgi:hypothetical protein